MLRLLALPVLMGMSVGALGQVLSPRFQLDQPAYVVSENDSLLVRVHKIGSGTGSVHFATMDASAVGGLDYESRSGWLHFLAVETNQSLPVIRTGNDFIVNGERRFTIVLSQPTAGTLGDPSVAEVALLDDDAHPADSFLEQRPPDPVLPSTNGAVRVMLEPSGTLGQWRMAGERLWRFSGDLALGLARGNHRIEYRPLPGFLSPSSLVVPILEDRTNQFIAAYRPNPESRTGAVTVFLEPSFVREDPDPALRGGWRLSGEPMWHESGDTLDAVPDGEYGLEFRSVPEFLPPANPRVRVFAGQRAEVTKLYLVAPTAGGLEPRPVTFDELVSTNLPYQFCGQVRSEFGWGSGVAVRERVVLTAAHVLFDDVHYRYADDVLWMHQKMPGAHHPVPQTPRGWYIFEGYAAQRQLDATPGIQSLNASQLDVAAMYFVETATAANLPARGAFSGFLASNAGALNEQFLSGHQMVLTGYPANADSDSLFATQPLPLSFTHLQGELFATDQIKGAPGLSGGALFAIIGGSYFPIGIHTSRSLNPQIRAFDGSIRFLLDRTDAVVDCGRKDENGVIRIEIDGQENPRGKRWLFFRVLPQIAVDRGVGLSNSKSALNLLKGLPGLIVVSTKSKKLKIQFRPVEGFRLPTNQTVHIAADQNSVIEVMYKVEPPELRFERNDGLWMRGTHGTRYRIQSSSGLAGVGWQEEDEVLLGVGWQLIPIQEHGPGDNRFYRAVWLP